MRTLLRLRRRLVFAALCALALGPALPVPARAAPPPAGGFATAPSDASAAVILMYHRFGEAKYPATNIRMEQFRAHLHELARPAYRVRPLPEIVEALRSGRPLPPRTVGLTIDDAYRSIYTQAWPLLKAAGLPFTIFVATEGVDRGYRELMSWAELRELVASGLVTLGNHSVSHLHMADHGRARNVAELRQASARIEAETGRAPTLLAYPYGETSTNVRAVAEELRFAAAFGQQSGAIGTGMDELTLPRFALNEHYGTLERFRLAVNALPLPVRDVIPQDPVLTSQNNPPLFGFTVAPEAGGLERLACYVAGQGRLALRAVGARRVEGRPGAPLPPGRTRINCTLPGPEGRWRWFGVQFYRPGS